MDTRAYIAVDLGAESGRVIVGTLGHDADRQTQPARLQLHEVHRFGHEPMPPPTDLRWNVPHIRHEILTGLRAAGAWARERGVRIVSAGVDCWGVDFVLLDAHGEMLAPPRCYRNRRHESGMGVLRDEIGFERLYEITGVQEMSINTLSQLAAAVAAGDTDLARAHRLLLMPDYFHYLLSGVMGNEACIASTSQMLDAVSGDWSEEVLAATGLPRSLLQTPYSPGKDLGPLQAEIAAQTGLMSDVRVVAPGSHDTASAVAGVPATCRSWAYLSSGTWSLMGVERNAPMLAARAHLAGFSNERGVAGTFRFQKNLTGLWLVQELRRDLRRSQSLEMDYAQLADAASQAPAFRTMIDAAHPSLAVPGGAIDKINALAREAGDPEPRTPGELARCCFESLAMSYAECLDNIESLVCDGGRRIETIHIVGGGSKNTLLNQMTADATGKRVLAGPAEATAAGNLLVQAMADGRTPELAGIRAIVASSLEVVEYQPKDRARWSEAYARHQRRRKVDR